MTRPTKFKAHFNRVNMQRNNPNVWTVHWRGTCYQVKKIIFSNILIQSEFKPQGKQPRAWFWGFASSVKVKGTIAYVSL